MTAQLFSWFGGYGFPIVACRGYSSVSLEAEVVSQVADDGREAILIYAGDHDPSGEDIDRNFVDKTACWADIERVALSSDQVKEYDLPVAVGKAKDSRAREFQERHGRLVQVELEALDANDLRGLYQDAINRYWDPNAYNQALRREHDERAVLREMSERDPAKVIRDLRVEIAENERTILELTEQIDALG
jgi:hypothetical protein